MFIKLFTVCGEETDYIEQGPALEANSSSARHEISSILWNPKVPYRVCNSLPLFPLLGRINPAHDLPSCFFKVHFSISSHIRLGVPGCLFCSSFPGKILSALLLSPIHAICPVGWEAEIMKFLIIVHFPSVPCGQWRTQEFCSGVGGSTNSIKDRESGDLGAVAPYSRVPEAAVIWYKKFHFIQ